MINLKSISNKNNAKRLVLLVAFFIPLLVRSQTSELKTSSWQTYENKKMGVSFMYPLEWVLRQAGEVIVIGPRSSSASATSMTISITRIYGDDPDIMRLDQYEKSEINHIRTYEKKISRDGANGSIVIFEVSKGKEYLRVILDTRGVEMSGSNHWETLFNNLLKTIQFI